MEKAPNSPEKLPHLANPKFLMPRDFTIAEVMNVIRGKISAAQGIEDAYDKTTGLMLLAQGKFVPKYFVLHHRMLCIRLLSRVQKRLEEIPWLKEKIVYGCGVFGCLRPYQVVPDVG